MTYFKGIKGTNSIVLVMALIFSIVGTIFSSNIFSQDISKDTQSQSKLRSDKIGPSNESSMVMEMDLSGTKLLIPTPVPNTNRFRVFSYSLDGLLNQPLQVREMISNVLSSRQVMSVAPKDHFRGRNLSIQRIYVVPGKIVMSIGEEKEIEVYGISFQGEHRLLSTDQYNIFPRTEGLVSIDRNYAAILALKQGISEIIITSNGNFIRFVPLVITKSRSEESKSDDQELKLVVDKTLALNRSELIDNDNSKILDFDIDVIESMNVSGIVTAFGEMDANFKPRPLEDIQVTLVGTDYITKTSRNGIFVFEGIPVNSTFEIDFLDFKGEFVRRRDKLSVHKQMPFRVYSMESFAQLDLKAKIINMEYDSGNAVCGQVLDNDDNPIAGIHVFSSGEENPYYFNLLGFPDSSLTKTNNYGRYCFFNLEPGLIVLSASDPDKNILGSTPFNVNNGVQYSVDIKTFLHEPLKLKVRLAEPDSYLADVSAEMVGMVDDAVTDMRGDLQFDSVPRDSLASVIFDMSEFEKTIVTIDVGLKHAVDPLEVSDLPLFVTGFYNHLYNANPEIILDDTTNGIIYVWLEGPFEFSNDIVAEAMAISPENQIEKFIPYYFIKQPNFIDMQMLQLTEQVEESFYRKVVLFLDLQPDEYNVSLRFGRHLISNTITRVLEDSISPVKFTLKLEK